MDRETMKILEKYTVENKAKELLNAFENFPFNVNLRRDYNLLEIFSLEKAFEILMDYKLLDNFVKSYIKQQFKNSSEPKEFLTLLEKALSTYDSAKKFIEKFVIYPEKEVDLPINLLKNISDNLGKLLLDYEKRFNVALFKRPNELKIANLFFQKLLSYAKGSDSAYKPKEKTLKVYNGLLEIVNIGLKHIKSMGFQEEKILELQKKINAGETGLLKLQLKNLKAEIEKVNKTIQYETALIFSKKYLKNRKSRREFLEENLEDITKEMVLEIVQYPNESATREDALDLLAARTSPEKMQKIADLENEHRRLLEEQAFLNHEISRLTTRDMEEAEIQLNKFKTALQKEQEKAKENMVNLSKYLKENLGLTINKTAQRNVNNFKEASGNNRAE